MVTLESRYFVCSMLTGVRYIRIYIYFCVSHEFDVPPACDLFGETCQDEIKNVYKSNTFQMRTRIYTETSSPSAFPVVCVCAGRSFHPQCIKIYNFIRKRTENAGVETSSA